MDLEKNQINIQRNPNNDLKYFNEVGYEKKNKDQATDKDSDMKESTLQYITE